MFFVCCDPTLRTSSWMECDAPPVLLEDGRETLPSMSEELGWSCASSFDVSMSSVMQTLVTTASAKHLMLQCRATITSGAVLIPDNNHNTFTSGIPKSSEKFCDDTTTIASFLFFFGGGAGGSTQFDGQPLPVYHTYSTIALVAPMSTTDVWSGIT